MNDKEFLRKLNEHIKPLSKEEREDILHDYEEHFAAAKEEGQKEEQIVEALGSPDKIGKEILAMYHITQAESETTTGNMLRAVWAGIGLSIFNVVVVLGPFIALAVVVFAGWIASLGLALSPLLLPVNMMVYPGTFIWSDVFFLMSAAGLGILLAVLMYYVTKGVRWIFIRYLKFNVSLVKGGLRT